VKIKAIKKGCVPSVSCSEDTGVLNMGKAGMITNQLFCCVGDKCNRINHVFPTIDMKPNGKICPACQALQGGDCGNEITQCTGNQELCFSVIGNTNLGEAVITTTLKGCTNRHMCTELQDHSASFSGISVVLSSTCKPAQSKAMMRVPWIARIISGQCGLFFQVLAGLLLMFLVL
ncbi:phospholipase A2 inhibitor and Ly6/PLAUR domain-containing protein-like, partial [Python bivittatus]|uniref:Phospholipase A2 inhibitor and Ly6/PLAUR domain-containing protein-like n=1 Tax=Python bivittatus TaxID=176946 RepID=A0A9F2RDZ6_PYTBI